MFWFLVPAVLLVLHRAVYSWISLLADGKGGTLGLVHSWIWPRFENGERAVAFSCLHESVTLTLLLLYIATV